MREPERRLEAVLKISELQAEKLQDARGALATVALLEDAAARDRATTSVVKALAAGGAVDEAREQVHGIRSPRLLVSAWSEIAKAEVQRDREAAAQEALGHGQAAVDQIAEARERDDGLLDLAEAQARVGDFAAALATAGRAEDPGVRALGHLAVAEVLGQVERR